MKADWIEVSRGDVAPRWAGYYASMNRKGQIAFNRVTHERMGSPEAVNILYDRVNNRIGLKPTSRAMRNAYPLIRWSNCGGRMVRALRVMTEFGIELPATVEFREVEIDQDGILILDLRLTRASARSAGHERRRGKRA